MLFSAPKRTKFPLQSMIFFLFRQKSHILTPPIIAKIGILARIPCLLFDINIPQCFHHRIAVQGIEPCQPKPYQPLSNLQFLITEGVSVSNDTATIHKSPIDRNYCSSTRLSGDTELMWRGFEPRRKDLLSHNVPEKYFLCIAFCNRHFIAFTHSATHQRPISGKRSV